MNSRINTLFSSLGAHFSWAPNPLEVQLKAILKQYQEGFQSNPHTLRKSISITQTWRFLIDGESQDGGCLVFDKQERGYLAAMMKAFQLIFTPSVDLTDFAKRLHVLATTDVDNLFFQKITAGPGEYRSDNLVCVRLNFKNSTVAGFQALLNEIKNYPDKNNFPVLRIDVGHKIFLYPNVVKKLQLYREYAAGVKNSSFIYKLHVDERLIPQDNLIRDHVNYHLIKDSKWYELFGLNSKLNFALFPQVDNDHEEFIPNPIHESLKKYESVYTHDIHQVKSKLDQLRVIISYIRKCEMLHPYLDGNTRNYSLLLLNHLLMVNGFPLTIQNNPNRIYAYTVDELIKEVLDGMQITLDFATHFSNANKSFSDDFEAEFSGYSAVERSYLQGVFKIEDNGRKGVNLITVAGEGIGAALNKGGLFGGVAGVRHAYSNQSMIRPENGLRGPMR
jgi:hypothetical protein